MGKRKDLTERERYQIEVLLMEKRTIKDISKILGRHYQTIYREVRRGTIELLDSELRIVKKYCADYSQRIADENKHEKGCNLKVGNDLDFIRYCEKMILEHGYSPQAVLYQIKNDGLIFNTIISKQTFYRYIDDGIFLNVTNKHLPLKREKKKQIHRKVKVALNNIKGRSIEERPKEVMDRDEFGHWEMDTVVGGRGKDSDCLLVLTERMTRYEYIFKIKDKSQKSVCSALNNFESIIGKDEFRKRFKTITMDNGTEFLDMKGVETSLDGVVRTTAYYCHPYCSFERGSNENANKLIRRHIPKGANISDYSNEDITKIQNWINNYPRGIFGGMTSNQYLKSIS